MTVQLTKKDFVSDQEVRWCPGCGDYAILANVQRVFPTLGIPREKFVIVSGIGCASRFPYYMDVYGMHGIHGRAPAIATGIKATRPDLSVWLVSGDGDALSIGGNHLLHVLRRNLDVKILLFNNRIYGLTKGQYSPTSEAGKKTKSTPAGSPDYPVKPVTVALGAEATFVARSLDTDAKHLQEMLTRAAAHRGTALVEIYQNCPIFNDGAYEAFAERKVREERMLVLEHGKPLLFAGGTKGVRLAGTKAEVIDVTDANRAEVQIYDETDPALAFLLSGFDYPELPVPMGVFRAVEREPYDAIVRRQHEEALAKKGKGDLRALLHSGQTWTVK